MILEAILTILAMIIYTLLGSAIGAFIGFIVSYVPIISSLIVEGFAVFGFNVVGKLYAVGAVIGLVGSLLSIVLDMAIPIQMEIRKESSK